jgi:S1-C subfamily serine protease
MRQVFLWIACLLLGERSATGMDSERGVYVVAVAKGSKADRNGLKANDVIIKLIRRKKLIPKMLS